MSRRRYDTQTATSVKIVKTSAISNMDAESVLTQYINQSTISESVLNQLKRVQRDLRGLPPILRNSATGETSDDSSQTVTKDIPATGDGDIEMTDSSVPKPIDKEERKRLKKERRKEEKRLKAQN
jgi:hypothetical protein